MGKDSKLPPTGRFERFRKLASVSARVGSDVLARGVKRFAGSEPKDLLSRGTAEKLAETLGDLKGAAMKLGQAVSMDPDLLPPEIRTVLARLQNEAPPMDFETVAAVVTEELGKPPHEAFEAFEEKSFAAASLGQVHRARVGGRNVAVKVQYPGIEGILRADLDGLGTLVKTLSLTSRSLDGRAYFQEIREQLMLEVDYRREARLAGDFAEAARALPELAVPRVFDSHSTGRVLTLELLEGVSLRAFVEAEHTNAEKMRVAELLIRATYGPFLTAGLVHADPHPGNFLVLPDGRLGVLDFGAVKSFSPTFLETHRRMFLHAVDAKPLDVLAFCRETGFTIDVPEDEAASLIEEILHIAGRPLRTDDYDYSRCEISRDMRKLIASRLGTVVKVRPPPEGVMFGRASGGLSQNLKLIGARGDYRGVYERLRALAVSSQGPASAAS